MLPRYNNSKTIHTSLLFREAFNFFFYIYIFKIFFIEGNDHFIKLNKHDGHPEYQL